MKLFNRIIEAKCGRENTKADLVIIHGLFGMSDNWVGIGKYFSKDRRVIIPDLRNHGRSPHSDNFSVDIMVNDIVELLDDMAINKAIILGHSMGGRVAMRLALLNQNRVSRLIVADMSMRQPKLRHEHWMIFETMRKAPIENMRSYKEIELFLRKHIDNQRLVLFILKNIRKTKEGYKWKLNYESLINSFEKETEILATDEIFDNPTLFIRGGRSDYILDEDIDTINNHFPLAIIETIDDAGHWLHADKPKEFMHLVESFI